MILFYMRVGPQNQEIKKKTGAELRKAQARLPIQFVLLVNSDLCKCEKRSSLSKVDKVKFKFKESSASSSSEIF